MSVHFDHWIGLNRLPKKDQQNWTVDFSYHFLPQKRNFSFVYKLSGDNTKWSLIFLVIVHFPTLAFLYLQQLTNVATCEVEQKMQKGEETRILKPC